MRIQRKKLHKRLGLMIMLIVIISITGLSTYEVEGANQNIRVAAESFGYEVDSDNDTKTVIIEKGNALSINLDNTQKNYATTWGSVPDIHQFYYMKEGLACAYVEDEQLKIVVEGEPHRIINIDLLYPILGDVIADEQGNFYVIWGKEGDVNTEETIFISKYSQEAKHIKTTGFEGKSIMGADGNTKLPFNAGTCESAFGNGNLMVNYAREMYSGHQSNNVIGVKTVDMSPVVFESKWDIPYCSHSFNQSIIYSEAIQDFVYADHGDAYSRSFEINVSDANTELEIFHFFLEANVNYNMYIVNETFAQMGGLAETNEGIAFVGASAKSISEDAKEEKQNLFVQIFDPKATRVKKNIFVGGEDRSGAMSFDINDRDNKPLESVTDYGVHWLTDYTDSDVCAPRVVSGDNKIVILWSSADGKGRYMVLDGTGEVLKGETILEGMELNSYEIPIYQDGTIRWVSVVDGWLKFNTLVIK